MTRVQHRSARFGLTFTVIVAGAVGVAAMANDAPRLELQGSDLTALDAINLRYFAPNLDQCDFSGDHTVEFSEGEILITLRPRKFPVLACIPAIPVQRYPVYVGRLPAGSYRITAQVAQPEPGSPIVIPEHGDRVSIDIELPPRIPRNQYAPKYDYTGAYWNPEESGWQLNVVHQDNDQLSIVWAAYDDEGVPVWYFALPGSWTDPITYRAPLARTTLGPPIRSDEFSNVQVESEVVGTIRISGDGLSGVSLGYFIDGSAHSRTALRYLQPHD